MNASPAQSVEEQERLAVMLSPEECDDAAPPD